MGGDYEVIQLHDKSPKFLDFSSLSV
jgi:hypothetical protein